MLTAAQPTELTDFEQVIRARMPERHLLDILKHAEHWSRYTRHFGPPSGADPKATPKDYRFKSVLSVKSYNSIPDGKCRP